MLSVRFYLFGFRQISTEYADGFCFLEQAAIQLVASPAVAGGASPRAAHAMRQSFEGAMQGDLGASKKL